MYFPLREICLTADGSLLNAADARNLHAPRVHQPAWVRWCGVVPLLRHPSRRLRRTVLALVALAALGGTGFALGSGLTINLTSSGPQPATASAALGDTVTFVNQDSAPHAIIASGVGLTTPALTTGQPFPYVLTKSFWGNYFKQDLHGVQGGAAPVVVGQEFDVDPYPTASVQEGFADMWCASLSHCMKRFEGKRATYKNIRSGGVGCFTVDSFPVFDYMRPNVYVIADSNHGYKMIGVGREVARVMTGGHSSVLYPFRFERFATGDLHPVSNSPYPWS